jgi:hypothetical protein
VKIGFYTALFPDLPIQLVAEWAAKENFDCLEVDINRHIADPAEIGQVLTLSAKSASTFPRSLSLELSSPPSVVRSRKLGKSRSFLEQINYWTPD